MKILIFATLLFFICTTPARAQVVLSEVYPAPTSEEKEWIELYNTSEEPISITGWKLFDHFSSKNELVVFSEVVVQPKSFLVFELLSNKLNNSEEKITLENAVGVEISLIHFTNSESQKSFSYLFIDGHTMSETLEITTPTKNAINPLLPVPTPTPSPEITPSPAPNNLVPASSTTPTPSPTPATIVQPVNEESESQTHNKKDTLKLDLHKKINEKLKIPRLDLQEKEGLEKQLPKISYLIEKKVSKEGVVSAIIGGLLLLATGLLL